MKYLNIEQDYFNIKLNNPLENSKIKYIERKGFLIFLYLDNHCGTGEVSPLPGFSKESLDESLWAVEQLKNALKKGSNYKPEDLFELFELFAADTPCLHFALDIALYDILGKINKMSISKYINKHSLSQIHFSTMNTNTKKENNIVKVKFGVNDINLDLQNFKHIHNTLPNNTCYRIDANNSYSVKDAIYVLNQLCDYNIEYIEEPLSDMSVGNLKTIKNNLNINIALDESIIADNYKQLISSGLISYVVLKASLFGGIEKIKKFSKYLAIQNINLVLSSALDSPIGNMSNIHVASFLKLNNKHGLNNYMFYDYAKNSVPYKDGSSFVDLSSVIGLGATFDN